MAWTRTRERNAQRHNFAVRPSYANNSGTARALCNGYSCYYNRHTINLTCLYILHTYMAAAMSVNLIQVRPPGYFMSVNLIQVGPPGYSITMPLVPTLQKSYI
jgi:hypothetical protein